MSEAMPVPYLPLADIAAIYRISPRTARRWAAHDHWRRTSGKPRRYHAGDVDASYRKHKNDDGRWRRKPRPAAVCSGDTKTLVDLS